MKKTTKKGHSMLYDVYVLARARNKTYVDLFLSQWAANFEEVASDYPMPQYSDKPVETYINASAVIEKLLEKSQTPYSIYWRGPKGGKISTAMVFFTVDGGLIAGVSIHHKAIEDCRVCLLELAKTVEGQLGGVFYETPPAGSIKEFYQMVLEWPVPKVLPGSFHPWRK